MFDALLFQPHMATFSLECISGILEHEQASYSELMLEDAHAHACVVSKLHESSA